MLSDRTVQAEQRPKLARFGETVRIIVPTCSSARLTRGLRIMADLAGDIFHSSESAARRLIQIKLAGD
jgi:hypothetical protein